MGNRFTNLCLGIRCGQGLETRLLGPTLEGPYTVVLSSPTAVKVAGVPPWILHMRVKRAYHETRRTPSGPHKRTPLIPVKPRSS